MISTNTLPTASLSPQESTHMGMMQTEVYPPAQWCSWRRQPLWAGAKQLNATSPVIQLNCSNHCSAVTPNDQIKAFSYFVLIFLDSLFPFPSHIVCLDYRIKLKKFICNFNLHNMIMSFPKYKLETNFSLREQVCGGLIILSPNEKGYADTYPNFENPSEALDRSHLAEMKRIH